MTQDPRNLQALLNPASNANSTMVKPRKSRMSVHRRPFDHLTGEPGEIGASTGQLAGCGEWPAQARIPGTDILRSGLSEKMLYNHNQTKTRFYKANAREAAEHKQRVQSKTYKLLRRVDFQGKQNSSKRDKIRVVIPNKKKTAKDFLFEKIFDGKSSQREVYEHFENTLIENSINGVEPE